MKLSGFTFLGLASLADPPKPTVYEAIRKCRASGVKVIMVTGDQALTAVSIAKKIGIVTQKSNIDLQK
jgi:P-type E1-E2 ATPase